MALDLSASSCVNYLTPQIKSGTQVGDGHSSKLGVLICLYGTLPHGAIEKSKEVIYMVTQHANAKTKPKRQLASNIIIVTMVIFFLSTLKVRREHEKKLG